MNILLIDLSSIGHMMWHTSANEPDPNAASIKTVERIRALASGTTAHVAIALDTPPYFRKDIDPAYKATRAKDNNAVISHQLAVAADVLRGDGFPLWGATGYEADDIIATAVGRVALRPDGIDTVTIASADKDILQLVSDRVSVKSLKDGNLIGPDEVKAKFGVWPHQMVDYLSLVGDASDNILGAWKIGPKRAAEVLETFGNLADAIKSAEEGTGADGISSSLRAFAPRAATVRDLITLRTDAPINFEQIFHERVTDAVATFGGEMNETQNAPTEPTMPVDPPVMMNSAQQRFVHPVDRSSYATAVPLPPSVGTGVAVREADVVSSQPVEWKMGLEPRTYEEAKQAALDLFAARMFSAYGNAPAVLSTILAGRELGFQMMASLRAFHVIEGKPSLSAGAIHSLVLTSGKAKYFRCIERTAERATFETQRGDDPPMSLSFTITEARAAWGKDEKAWLSSGWGRNPADMLVARALTKLARLVYPDITHGLYAPEELS